MASPDWSDLQYFLAVFHAGSFHAAAAKLGVEHTTLSRRVSRLEKTLGTTLLTRSARGAAFTAGGRALAATLQQVALQLLAVSKEVERDALRGQVRITTAGIFANAFLADQLAQLHAALPRIEPVLLVDTHFATLAEGNVDLAVRLLPERRTPADADVKALKVTLRLAELPRAAPRQPRGAVRRPSLHRLQRRRPGPRLRLARAPRPEAHHAAAGEHGDRGGCGHRRGARPGRGARLLRALDAGDGAPRARPRPQRHLAPDAPGDAPQSAGRHRASLARTTHSRQLPDRSGPLKLSRARGPTLGAWVGNSQVL
jgi:DNA-binding transcriptional LysR family regulator